MLLKNMGLSEKLQSQTKMSRFSEKNRPKQEKIVNFTKSNNRFCQDLVDRTGFIYYNKRWIMSMAVIDRFTVGNGIIW